MKPLLDAMGGQPMYVSENQTDTSGATSATYTLIYSALMSFIHGSAIAHTSNIDVDTYANNLIRPFIAGGSLMNYLSRIGQAAHKRKYDENIGATLYVWIDALDQTIGEIAEIDMTTEPLDPLMAQLQEARAAGYGDLDIACVFETLILNPKSN